MSSFSGDYYQRLRLPKTASRQEIKLAFRRLSRQYHPERHPNLPTALRTFKALHEAYEVLIDPVQRQHYDQIQPRSGEAITGAALSRANYRLSNPKEATDFYLRGIRYALAQRYLEAIQEYDKAIARSPNLEAAYLRRAEVRYYLGDDPGVLADCQRAIALDPTEPQAHYYLGLARSRLGYVQSAIAAFTSAIAQDCEDAQSFARRGLAYEDLGDLREAAQDFRRAAQLYKAQGDLVKYGRLRQYLRRFGTAGRSRPIRALSWVSRQLANLWTGLWLGLKSGLGIRPYPPRTNRLSASPDKNEQIRQQSVDQLLRKPKDSDFGLYISTDSLRRSRPPSERDRRGFAWGESQAYWAPGISSRPADNNPRLASNRWLVRSLGHGLRLLRLLSNPAGELVPVYRQLSHAEVNRAGYGLAVLANLCLMFGLMSLFSQTSWLQASWLWAAGGTAYVAMVLAVAIARLCLRTKGLWAADIFTVGAAVVPLGICAGAAVGIKAGIRAIAQHSTLLSPSLVFWLPQLLILLAIFWSLSHSLIALYSGLCQLHPFPPRVAAWFAPAVVIVGLIVGVGTWSWLAISS